MCGHDTAARGSFATFGIGKTVSLETLPVGMLDRAWVRRVVSEAFASPRIVSRGVLHVADGLSGFAGEEAGEPVGLLLYDMRAGECEVVLLLSLEERRVSRLLCLPRPNSMLEPRDAVACGSSRRTITCLRSPSIPSADGARSRFIAALWTRAAAEARDPGIRRQWHSEGR